MSIRARRKLSGITPTPHILPRPPTDNFARQPGVFKKTKPELLLKQFKLNNLLHLLALFFSDLLHDDREIASDTVQGDSHTLCRSIQQEHHLTD